MKKLAASSGVVIYEDLNKLFVCKKPAQWTSNFLFVTGVLGFILLATGTLQLFFLKDQPGIPPKLGIALFVAGMFVAFIFWRGMLYKRKINAIPFNELKSICILDFTNNNLLNDGQNILSSLSNVFLLRKMQITSSSPELVLEWSSGSITIVKGNPFSGGIGDIESVLVSKGIKKR